ncbi:FeoB-associated Cys-rich membrane protein [Proteiniborus sp. MB09-C3]|nr:FeoB-associated Cys-rich membrane protein [Proteiniborus sp. MB09-C3]WIV12064.1 FeoB-associated Cys-rich membrane protein [Proteiniborus sp. MB09-C3]
MATAIIGILIGAAFVGVSYYTYKHRKKCSSCCSGCSSNSECHK